MWDGGAHGVAPITRGAERSHAAPPARARSMGTARAVPLSAAGDVARVAAVAAAAALQRVAFFSLFSSAATQPPVLLLAHAHVYALAVRFRALATAGRGARGRGRRTGKVCDGGGGGGSRSARGRFGGTGWSVVTDCRRSRGKRSAHAAGVTCAGRVAGRQDGVTALV